MIHLLRFRPWTSVAALSFTCLGTAGLAPACGSSSSDTAATDDAGGRSDTGSLFTQSDAAGTGDGSVTGPSCATAEALAAREPVYIDIILDGSRSMDGHGSTAAGCDNTYSHSGSVCFVANSREQDPLDPNRTLKVCHDAADPIADCPSYKGLTGKKWLAIRGALLAFFEGAKTKADPRLGLGMYLFGSDQPKPSNQWDVQPAFVDAVQLDKLKVRITPPNYPTSGGTPLRGSIQGQAPLVKGFAPALPLEAGGKRVFLVVTDGAATDCTPQQPCFADVAALLAGTPNVLTFVIGVGEPTATDNSVFDETFLSRMAFAGGAAPTGCNKDWDGQNPTGTPCHFQVTPGAKTAAQIQAEMAAAMDTVASKVQSCELVLSKTSPIDPSKVNVVFRDAAGKETQVPKDGTNGWSYDNEASPSKVILSGTACAALKADAAAQVKVVIGCPTGTIVR